jgi:peptidoglycan-binding lysin domain protein
MFGGNMRKLFLAFIFTLFLVSFLIGRANTTRAGMNKENIRYTSVKVEYGDSLDSISRKYNNIGISNAEYVKEVLKMNGMNSDRVHPGCFIVVSYKEE